MAPKRVRASFEEGCPYLSDSDTESTADSTSDTNAALSVASNNDTDSGSDYAPYTADMPPRRRGRPKAKKAKAAPVVKDEKINLWADWNCVSIFATQQAELLVKKEEFSRDIRFILSMYEDVRVWNQKNNKRKKYKKNQKKKKICPIETLIDHSIVPLLPAIMECCNAAINLLAETEKRFDFYLRMMNIAGELGDKDAKKNKNYKIAHPTMKRIERSQRVEDAIVLIGTTIELIVKWGIDGHYDEDDMYELVQDMLRQILRVLEYDPEEHPTSKLSLY